MNAGTVSGSENTDTTMKERLLEAARSSSHAFRYKEQPMQTAEHFAHAEKVLRKYLSKVWLEMTSKKI